MSWEELWIKSHLIKSSGLYQNSVPVRTVDKKQNKKTPTYQDILRTKYLRFAVPIVEKIVWFDVPMNDAKLVDVF